MKILNMKEKIKKIIKDVKSDKNKRKEILYYVFFSAFVVYWFINLVYANVEIDFKVLKNSLIVVGAISFGLMLINTKFTKQEIFVQIGIVLFLLYFFVASGGRNTGLLLFYPAIIGLKNVRIKNAVKVMMWTLIFSTIILFVLSIIRNNT